MYMNDIQVRLVPRRSKLWKLWPLLFKGANMDTVYISFGYTIYAPPSIDLKKGMEPSLLEHEYIHLLSQNLSKAYAVWWWIKYILSKDFRYKEELLAYSRQLGYIVHGIKDRNKKFSVYNDVKNRFAEALSGPLYGNMAEYGYALRDLGELVQI